MHPLAILLALLVLPAGLFAADEVKVGASAIVITPPPGTPLAGYYRAREASKVLDDLYAKALVLECQGNCAALVVCDLISLSEHIVRAAREQIEKETGIPGKHVMISATHTHTAPVLVRHSARDALDGGNTDLSRRYSEQLPSLIVKCVAEAKKKLQVAQMGAAIGKEESLSFNRRFWMKDGSVGWNPAKNHPDIVKPAGPIDPDVHVLYFETPQLKPIATYVNFAMHPDTTGGTGISADYPGVLAARLGEYKGSDMVTLFANGCCGDINHRNIRWTDRQSGVSERNRIGNVLAGTVCKTFPKLQTVAGGILQVERAFVKLDLPMLTPGEIAEARAVLKRINDPKTKFMEKVNAFKVLDVEQRQGKPWEVEVQVISLGRDLAWVSLPGEMFVELGLAIKKESPFRFTQLAELANGSIGYIPTEHAYAEGNYEVVSTRCAAGSGEKLVAAATKMLKTMYARAAKE